ncbi:MAG: hypothetical protein EBU90_03550 [Proteobacteria bacterium]|nr:hypothetical protein [Pseudomonadota bacterium]NBP13400.1 hypothetical protein [bacterium]
MAHLEKYTQLIKNTLEPYFGNPLVFDESRDAISMWKNFLFIKGSLHYGHLEAFRSPKIEVLHANFYAHPLIEAPDLGFDVIWLNENCTGYFFDYSNNTVPHLQEGLAVLKERFKHIPDRDIPEWATTFSKESILKRPEDQDQVTEMLVLTLSRFGFWASHVNEEYNKLLDGNINARQRIADRNNYIKSLKQNPKTSMALASLIGKEDAELFMENILYRSLE